MKKMPLSLYKEFVEENGLEEKLEKWAEKRTKAENAKPSIQLGKLVDRRDLVEGQAYWTGDIDDGGPEAWIYSGDRLMCFGKWISPFYADKLYEISMADYQKCVNWWIVKEYGQKYFESLQREAEEERSR